MYRILQFCQQYEDHFATTKAIGQNKVLFAATFLKSQALNCWQQHKEKIDSDTFVSIS